MAKWKVNITGSGKIGNDVKHLNKSIEINEDTMRDLQNTSKKDAVLQGLIAIHYPGVEVDTKKIGLHYQEIKDKKSKTSGNIGEAAIAGAVGGIVGANLAGKKKKKDSTDKTKPFGAELIEIGNYTWDGDLDDTLFKLRNILQQTQGYKWDVNPNEGVPKENNRILTRCYKQYKKGFKYYKSQTDYKTVKRGMVKFRFKKLFSKNLLIVIFTTLAIFFAIVIKLSS